MNKIEKRITVSAFAEKYSTLSNEELKDKYVKEHIMTTYAPILSKKIILEAMTEKSVADSSTGKYIDFVVSKLNVIMAVLALYTDIEPDKSEDGTPLTWEAYDTLRSTGLYEKILNSIGKDIEELMTIQSHIIETWHMKNTSTAAYISNITEMASQKFGTVATSLVEKINGLLDDEVKVNKVANNLEKLLKKIK